MADQPPSPPAGVRSSLDGAFASLRGLGLHRNRDDRWLAGVCSGVADRLRIDPLVVRGVLIVLLFVGGIGGLAYLVAWALLPDRDGRILAEEALHGHGWGIVLLVLIGIVMVSDVVDRWWLWLVLLPVGALGWWAVSSSRAGRTPDQMAEDLRRKVDHLVGAAESRPESEPRPYAAMPPSAAGPTTAAPATAVPTTSAPAPAAAPAPAPASAAASASVPTPHPLGPGRSGPVATAPRVVTRNRPRGGLLALLLTAGLVVAGYGAGSLLATDRSWSGSPELVGGAFALAGAGLALVVVGLAGRRAGFSVVLVTVLAGLTVLGTSLPHVPGGGFGERTWLASAPPAGGFTLTAGEATLSLADAPAGRPVRVEIGAGELTVRVPAGFTADVTSTVRVGQLTVKGANGTQQLRNREGVSETRALSVGSGPTRIPLEIIVGAGDVTIVEVP